MKGNDIFGVVVMYMCLASDLTILDKFKTSDFKKYKEHPYPRIHLVMYYMKMVANTKNDKLLIHCF